MGSYGVNFNLSENPNHYLILIGLFYLILGAVAWAVSPSELKKFTEFIFWQILFVAGFGLVLLIIGYKDLKKKYDMSHELRNNLAKVEVGLKEVEVEIKKEELKSLRRKK